MSSRLILGLFLVRKIMYKYLVLPVFTLFFLNHGAILDSPMLTVLKSSIGSFPDFNAMVSFAYTKKG
jgi:hypothetical protein